MFRATVCFVAMSLSACSFPRPQENGELFETDARPGIDAPPAKPCIPGFVDLCSGITVQPGAFTVNGNMEIDSDADTRCQRKAQPGAGDVCVLSFASISITNGATLLVHGSRPVVLASASTFSIEGTLDVSSRRSRLGRNGAGSSTCPFAATPENDLGGGGGGAGGSFATKGGDGGTGDLNQNGGADGTASGGVAGALVAQPTLLRGGCNGQNGGAADGGGGTGAPSGGAVYVFAKGALSISGQVLASGAGGQGGAIQNGGGGGAGSGGLIVLESETQSLVSGLLLATGGGGGEGADIMDPGQVGADPASPAVAAGGAARVDGGNGGNGATSGGGAIAATSGQNANGGGGGGGGGNGFIIVRGAGRQLAGNSAPTPILP